MYKISEKDLRFLVEAEIMLNALQCGGVDNWHYYSDAFSDAIEDWKEEHDLSPDTEIELEDIVDKEMERYTIIEGE